MKASLEILLQGLIDYAGLFPPAGLDMEKSVANYASYRQGPQSAWLGRFVLPAARLIEFEIAAAQISPAASGRLSVLAGPDLTADLERVAAFNAAQSKAGAPRFLADALEIKADRSETILEATIWIPDSMAAYFEIPIRENPSSLLAAISRSGARAKVRTGGVAPEAFPSTADLARFIAQCAEKEVAFKATAGLHHPLRSTHPLTYEPGAPSAPMFGFVNVFLAAALARRSLGENELAALLEEKNPGAFSFDENGAAWNGHSLNLDQLRAARKGFAISFGSCSFDEPVQDLRKLGWA